VRFWEQMHSTQRRVVLVGAAICVLAVLYSLWPMPEATWIGVGGVRQSAACGPALLEKSGLGACARLAATRMPFAYGLALMGAALVAVPMATTFTRR
jgi:hypothetical protein